MMHGTINIKYSLFIVQYIYVTGVPHSSCVVTYYHMPTDSKAQKHTQPLKYFTNIFKTWS